MPLPGDSIDFSSVNNVKVVRRSVFVGVDPGSLVLSDARVRFPLYETGFLRVVGGPVVNLSELEAALADRRLPTVTSLAVVQVGEDYVELPVSQIGRIRNNEARNAKFTGLAIGLATDALVFVVLAHAFEHEASESCNFLKK